MKRNSSCTDGETNYKNIMEAPKLEKIVVNMGVGD